MKWETLSTGIGAATAAVKQGALATLQSAHPPGIGHSLPSVGQQGQAGALLRFDPPGFSLQQWQLFFGAFRAPTSLKLWHELR